MEKNRPPICPATWFSGFFGLGAFVHLVRLVLQIPLTVGTWTVPLWASGALAIVLGSFSVGLLILAVKKPCESGHACCGQK